jgi:hypothetical protein
MSEARVPPEGRDTNGSYYAKGGYVWKSPIKKCDDATGSTSLTIGFRVCKMMDEVGDEAAETVAALMNAGDKYLNATPTADAELAKANKQVSDLTEALNVALDELSDRRRDQNPLMEAANKGAARIAELEAALEWYAGHAADCRKITAEGDVARQELDRDGGARARAALRHTPGETG